VCVADPLTLPREKVGGGIFMDVGAHWDPEYMYEKDLTFMVYFYRHNLPNKSENIHFGFIFLRIYRSNSFLISSFLKKIE
jgi:hypothetical protein